MSITLGSLVGLRTDLEDRSAQTRVLGWIRAYGEGPFTVTSRPTADHVVLAGVDGVVIHFGSTGDPSLSTCYVRPWAT